VQQTANNEWILPGVDVQPQSPEEFKKDEGWALLKGAIEKDWGGEVPSAFQAMCVLAQPLPPTLPQTLGCPPCLYRAAFCSDERVTGV